MFFCKKSTKIGAVLFLLNTVFALNAAPEKYPEPVQEKLDLARYYLYINEDSSLLYNNEVYDWAVRNKKHVLESEVLLLKAEILLYKGEIDRTLDISRTIRETAQNTGDRFLLVSAMLLQGRCYTELNMFDKAYSELSAASDIAEQTQDSIIIGLVFNAFGVLYDLQMDPEQALVYYEKGLAYAANTSDALLRIRLLNNKAIVYTTQGRLDDAEEILSDCIRYVREQRIAFGLDRLYMNLAAVYTAAGKMDSALLTIRKSLDIAEQHANLSSIARSLIYRGYILFSIGELEEAGRVFREADTLAQRLGAENMHCMILSYFAWIAEAEKDYEQAYYYLQRFKQKSDSLANKRNVVNMVRLKMENEAAQAELTSRYQLYRMIMITALMALALILVGVIFLYWYKRSRKLLKNKQMENSHLASELEQENKKMVTQSIYQQKKTKDLSDIADALRRSRAHFKPANQSLIDQTIASLEGYSDDEKWEDFEARFERVHTGFLKNLQKKYPNLSPNERKLCAYLRLDMTTKEIANIMHVSTRAVEQSRYRLRKKLNVKKAEDLNHYLCTFD